MSMSRCASRIVSGRDEPAAACRGYIGDIENSKMIENAMLAVRDCVDRQYIAREAVHSDI